MTERLTGISENQQFAQVVFEPSRQQRPKVFEKATGNPDAVAGISRENLTEAAYWQAFSEKLDVKFALVRLEAKIYQKTQLGEPTDAEEAEWQRLKRWEFTLQTIFKAAEPQVLRPKGEKGAAFSKSFSFVADRGGVSSSRTQDTPLARAVGMSQKERVAPSPQL